MDKPADRSSEPTGDALPSLRHDEIEGMLEQAQSLAENVAQSVGLEPQERTSSAESALQLGQIEADAESAVELVSQAVDHLSRELKTVSIDDDLPMPGTEATLPEVDHVQCEEDEVPAESVEATMTADPEVVVAAPSEVLNQERSELDEADASRIASTESDPPTGESAVESTLEPSAAKKKRLLSIRDTLVRATMTGVNGFLLLVRLIDLPFSRLSPGAKDTLGVVGLISLVMGVGAMVLPKLLINNPYASMPPFPKAAAAAGGETPAITEETGASKHEAASGHH